MEQGAYRDIELSYWGYFVAEQLWVSSGLARKFDKAEGLSEVYANLKLVCIKQHWQKKKKFYNVDARKS